MVAMTGEEQHGNGSDDDCLHVNEIKNHPRITAEEEEQERAYLGKEEKLLAYADLSGCRPIDLVRLEDFEREISYLSPSRKEALHKGYTLRQARQFLFIENNDPKRAAERMARYWELRAKNFGEQAFLGENTFRTLDDHRRIFEMAQKALKDEEVDLLTRKWADHCVDKWNRAYSLYLDKELNEIQPEHKVALMEAQTAMPNLTSNMDHKIMFLMSEDYDAQRAAHRMVRYWDFKVNLFGSTFVAHDLMEEHSREMSLSFFKILPGTDTSGRALLCMFPGRVLEGGYSVEGILKIMWCTFHQVLDNKACKEKGIVLLVILKGHGKPSKDLWKFASKMIHLIFNCVPIKIRAIHDCSPPGAWFIMKFAPILKWIIGKKMRMRYWIHGGPDEQILADLRACGISINQIPSEIGGDLDFESLERVSLN